MPNPKYEAPGWDKIYDMLVELGRKIRKSGYQPQVIVGVSRGGWPPARVLSDLLENQNLANVKVEFYKDIGVRAEAPKITQPVTSNVKGQAVLLVDDVADSGHSLRVVVSHLRRRGAREIRVCTLYLKPLSVFKPDFYARKTSRWIIFPWERLEAVQLISRRLDSDGTPVSSIIGELKGSGMSVKLVRELMRLNSDAGKN